MIAPLKKLPFILEIYRGKDGDQKALVVDDTLYCGICKPQETPVTLKELSYCLPKVW